MQKVYERIDSLTSPEPNSGCWLWSGSVNEGGYAQIRAGDKLKRVHRINYERFVGMIPDGKLIRHRCDIRCCINPGHLMPGTSADNARDVDTRGRRNLVALRQRFNGENNPNSVLTIKAVRAIRILYDSGEFTIFDISEIFNIAYRTAYRVILRKSWQSVA